MQLMRCVCGGAPHGPIPRYTCVLRNRECDGGESGPPRQLNTQQQPAQLGPNCTDRRGSGRGCRRWPSTRVSLGTKTGPRKSSTEALHNRSGSLDIERPGFPYSSGPLSPRGQWTRAGHQVEPGDESCLQSKEPVVPTESTSIRGGKRRRGQQHMGCAGRWRHALQEPPDAR